MPTNRINTNRDLSCIPTLQDNGFVCARMDRGVWKKENSSGEWMTAYISFFGDGTEFICIDVNGELSRVVNNIDSLKSLLTEIDRKDKLNKLFD